MGEGLKQLAFELPKLPVLKPVETNRGADGKLKKNEWPKSKKGEKREKVPKVTGPAEKSWTDDY